MNSIEKKMVGILKTLRENYGVTAVKVNMEAEGIRLEEMLRTKEIVMNAGVGLTVKIGGCEALTDLRLSKMYGVNTIMGPMIESTFALEKYLTMVESEYAADELEDLKRLINIETVDGYQKFDHILGASNIHLLDGIVLGRTDLAAALNLKDVNAPEVLSIAKDLFSKARKQSLICIVGGGISVKSIPFFKELKGLLTGFETRKVVFADYGRAEANMEEGIPLALKFEYHWYEWKQRYYGAIYNEDASKMKSLSTQIGV
jgi:4-hydroxy-2-oxoheptanedioate aldolase